jgi:hypothetical protein
MFDDDPGWILDRHRPAAKVDHLGAEGNVMFMENRLIDTHDEFLLLQWGP